MKKNSFFIIVLSLSFFIFVSCGESIEEKSQKIMALNSQMQNIKSEIYLIENKIRKAEEEQTGFKTLFFDSEEVDALQERHEALLKAYNIKQKKLNKLSEVKGRSTTKSTPEEDNSEIFAMILSVIEMIFRRIFKF